MFVFFKKPLAALIVVFVIVFSSCSISHMVFGDGGSWLPQDMDLENTVLLVSPFGSKGDMKKVEKFMKNNYPYRYKICPSDSLASFTDTQVYRFMLLPISQGIALPYNTISSRSYWGSVEANDFYFLDRLKNKKYPQTYKGSYNGLVTFKPLITTVVRHYKHSQ